MATRSFQGRRRAESAAVPPGQYVTDDFPVLTAGPTEYIDEADWKMTITDGTKSKTYDWHALHDLGTVDLVTDFHCVTHWSKIGATWTGVPVSRVFEDAGVEELEHAIVKSYGGYTTNLPTQDLLEHDAMIAVAFERDDLTPSHGGPVRLFVPHLYLWKSAKWLSEIRFTDTDEPGFWERAGYHNYGDPWREQRYYSD